MFHILRRSSDPEPSPGATHALAHIGRLSWFVATILGGVLLIGMALFPIVAAASPSLQAATSSSDNRPLLKVVPAVVDPSDTNFYCKLQQPIATCHVTLTERLNSTLSLHWFTRSDIPVKISPSSGSLSPGQSVRVTITINLTTCNSIPKVYFVGPKNVASVILFCD